jgi:hypothetical protein
VLLEYILLLSLVIRFLRLNLRIIDGKLNAINTENFNTFGLLNVRVPIQSQPKQKTNSHGNKQTNNKTNKEAAFDQEET